MVTDRKSIIPSNPNPFKRILVYAHVHARQNAHAPVLGHPWAFYASISHNQPASDREHNKAARDQFPLPARYRQAGQHQPADEEHLADAPRAHIASSSAINLALNQTIASSYEHARFSAMAWMWGLKLGLCAVARTFQSSTPLA